MTYLVERLAELRRYLEALDHLAPVEQFVEIVRGIEDWSGDEVRLPDEASRGAV